MSINAKIGQRISLTGLIPNDQKILIGLGWERKKAHGETHDLDSAVIMLEASGLCAGPQDLCFYKEGFRTQHNDAVIHQGDNSTGSELGDDERILISLADLPDRIKALVVVVSIYDAENRGQNFGQVDDAWVRLANPLTKADIITYDLAEDATAYTAVEFALIARDGAEWTFQALGKGTTGGFGKVLEDYGLTVKK